LYSLTRPETEISMANEQSNQPTGARLEGFSLRLSLDWWAVIAALVLVIAVLIGLIPSVPW
jgi:hypothetical protein